MNPEEFSFNSETFRFPDSKSEQVNSGELYNAENIEETDVVPRGRRLTDEERHKLGRPEFCNAVVRLKLARGKMDRKALVNTFAKQFGVDGPEMLQLLRMRSKEQIAHPEKVIHYHRTSLERFDSILGDGALLSRPEIMRRHPELKIPGASASDDVMMTRDQYDPEGTLIAPGLTDHEAGASGGGVVFALGPELMDYNSYDSMGVSPTISHAPLKETCSAVLIVDEKDREEVQQRLEENNLGHISVVLRSEWEKQRYASN